MQYKIREISITSKTFNTKNILRKWYDIYLYTFEVFSNMDKKKTYFRVFPKKVNNTGRPYNKTS